MKRRIAESRRARRAITLLGVVGEDLHRAAQAHDGQMLVPVSGCIGTGLPWSAFDQTRSAKVERSPQLGYTGENTPMHESSCPECC